MYIPLSMHANAIYKMFYTEIFKRCVDEVAHNLTRQDSLLLADKLGIRKAAIERSKQESSDFECTKRLLMSWHKQRLYLGNMGQRTLLRVIILLCRPHAAHMVNSRVLCMPALLQQSFLYFQDTTRGSLHVSYQCNH